MPIYILLPAELLHVFIPDNLHVPISLNCGDLRSLRQIYLSEQDMVNESLSQKGVKLL